QTGRESPYELSGTKIKPIIYLEDKISLNNDIPDFVELKEYCFTLLEDIKREVYPIHQIHEV
ncbi:MAG: hypothetical protein O9353_10090, partial [Bacteroidia bacterium]|nr:hypothetical protein [Bacteroidia bacterium]